MKTLSKEEKGYVHIYTGDGKGKTTAAFGLALRALMSGKRVFIGQFVKSMKYNETKLEDLVDGLKIEQYGRGCFIFNKPDQNDIDMAKDGLNECEKILKSGDYDMVILDEITIALHFKLLSVEEVIRVIKERNPEVEVVVTGRCAPDELIEIGDVVTEMKEVKHYYSTIGLEAREGIER